MGGSAVLVRFWMSVRGDLFYQDVKYAAGIEELPWR